MIHSKKILTVFVGVMSLGVGCESTYEAASTTAAIPAPGQKKEEKSDSPREQAEAWVMLEESSMSEAQQRQLNQAIQAQKDASNVLLGTVKDSMKSSGPSPTVALCSSAAPGIIATVSQARGLRLGRTSHKLRNPANVAPVWAKKHVAAGKARSLRVLNQDGRLGVLNPIMVKPPCLNCHGDPATFFAGLNATLAQHYPLDAAVGFKNGDLRGWFWFEVPALQQEGFR